MNLLDEFDHYFNEPECYGLRSERLYWLLEADQPRRFEIVENWLKWAYIKGAEQGYQHSLSLIENYYKTQEPSASKPELAALEVASALIQVAGTNALTAAEKELNG